MLCVSSVCDGLTQPTTYLPTCDDGKVRGGSEAYFAYADDAADTIEKGTRIVVLEQDAPRTVIVGRLT